jgi:hypothetical protein
MSRESKPALSAIIFGIAYRDFENIFITSCYLPGI